MVSVCLAKKPPTYNSPESLFRTSFLDEGLDLQKTPEDPRVPHDSGAKSWGDPEGPNQPQPGPQCTPRSPGVPQSWAIAVSGKDH